ncbi:TRAP transporter small permease subunit [Cupriavidus basilensis]|uniref:TRAP transporter small permease protein n=1 Tax=Cupriavidus basilensis TaxID=68895 RepID=A0ABT6ATX8_9BURK|nr:TRAP transporter small permease subunit [Cupriavidus basilensis]MDF3835136.1 TRAP transporter small permease subunit [Cupriavidus basilensis]
MRTFLNRLYDGAGALGAFSVFLIFVLMIAAGVGRRMNWQVSGVNDIVAWLCPAVAFFAMAHAFRHGDFVRVTLLLDKVTARMRRTLDTVCLVIAAISVAYLTWWAAAFTWESYEYGEMATGLVALPIWTPQARRVLLGLPTQLLRGLALTRPADAPDVPSMADAIDPREGAAPITGTVQGWKVVEGEAVSEGQIVAVMEAMKMEMQVCAHRAGRIARRTAAGNHATAGAQLAFIE